MFTFFRKIRHNLLNQGKTIRYLKYAIGEIVLVVIGILIALQINNWNEQRKKQNDQLELISGFYVEVIQNIEYTEGVKEKNQNRLIIVQSLLNISMQELETLSEEQINIKLLESAKTGSYAPLVSKLNRLLSTEDLQFKKSTKLINLLYFYRNSIHELKIQSDTVLDTFVNKQIPLFNKNISVKNVMHQRRPNEISKSKNTVDVKSFINSLAFENLYSDLYATAIKTDQLLNENMELMQKIIQHIEENNTEIIND